MDRLVDGYIYDGWIDMNMDIWFIGTFIRPIAFVSSSKISWLWAG